ncbi:hypothetical protein L9F63_011918 [Diploptera punctata]|uniref:Heparanase n=1 Tax=Diploptera punctata TaxID=6984 RepID=A0AAD8AE13_DIPPU|nr:hypothetical protein L9F63_011918 [Diploptera punctata]
MCGRQLLYKHDGKRQGNDTRLLVTIFVCLVGGVLVCVGFWHIAGTHTNAVYVTVLTKKVLQIVDEKFLSLGLDSSKICDGWVNRNIRSEKLVKLANMLSPGYLRVGGTLADRLVFVPDSDTRYSSLEEDLKEKCTPQNTSFFNMSASDWIGLNEFAQNAQLHLLFDLNVLLRTDSQWNDSNARVLLNFSDKRDYIINWQLGNEPNAFRHVFGISVPGETLGHDFNNLRELLDEYPRYKKSILIGPDVTRPVQRVSLEESPTLYLSEFLKVANSSINAISWHQYYVNGRKAKLSDFVKPHVLNILSWQISAIKASMSGVTLPMWLSETSSAYGGGAPKLSDRFVAGFMWLDKLGLAARMGVSVVIRQSLIGGNYALLDDLMNPLPDWWLSVLYKQLVGRGVLEVLGATEHVRIYSHCSRHENAVTLFGMNLSNLPSLITVSGLPTTSRVLTYILTCDVFSRLNMCCSMKRDCNLTQTDLCHHFNHKLRTLQNL